MKCYPFILFFLLNSLILWSQGNNDIILFDLKADSGQFELSSPKNITNREGYDNQPYFNLSGDKIYYSSIHEDGQSDIYAYDIQKEKSKRITKTEESEYSPVLLGDTAFSVVRVDKDSLQRLYIYDLKNKKIQLVTSHQDSVGYYTWLNDTSLAIFVLPEPFELRIITTGSKAYKKVTDHLGHSFHVNPINNRLTFITEYGPGEWFISELNNIDEYRFEVNPIINAIDDAKSFTISVNGDILMCSGSKLFKYNAKTDQNWVEIYDGNKDGFNHFYRVSVSQDLSKIAMVTETKNDE